MFTAFPTLKRGANDRSASGEIEIVISLLNKMDSCDCLAAAGAATRVSAPAVLPLQYGVSSRAEVLRLAPSARFADGIGRGGRIHKRMSQQPESTSSTLTASPAPLPGQAVGPVPTVAPQAAGHAPQRIPRWLERIELLLRVMLRMYIGLAVCYAPWSPVFWDQNPLFQQFPTLSAFAANGAVRGIVSGLGLLNLWIALHDVLRHREG